ncbi:hypothetical protein [Streptomyces sp. NPDC050121]
MDDPDVVDVVRLAVGRLADRAEGAGSDAGGATTSGAGVAAARLRGL